jgi:hypothetical protein
MSDQMTRLMQLLIRLPMTPRFLTGNQIKRIYETEKFKDIYPEKIQRDIKKLKEIFPNKIGTESYIDWNSRTGHDLADDKSQHIFWESLTKPLDLASLTVSQALSLCLLKKFLLPLIPQSTYTALEPFFDEATNTLEKLKNENLLSNWPNKIAIVNPTQPLLAPEVDPGVHHVVSEALLYDHQLEIQYRRSDGEINNYQVNPLGLVLRNGSCYLVATKTETQEKRIFALHRIQNVKELDTLAVRPDDCDLQHFIDQGHMGFDLTGAGVYKVIQLKAIFDPITANHLSESRLSEDQVIKKLDDQHYEVTATIQETEQLFWWLLSFGFRVEVLEPPALRKKMADSVKVLANKYQITDVD